MSPTPGATHASARSRDRIGAIDTLRGLAICGMVAFHLAWDLHAFGWTDLDPSDSFGWRLFGQAVACCFLFLSGLGLVLARQRGAGAAQALRRIGLIAGAAMGVTLVTAAATPGETVWFGILHCIALANLLALPLLDGPPATILAGAGAALATPWIVAGRAPAAWWWLGLSDQLPRTIDVRPLLPWLGVVLLGVWAGRMNLGAWLRGPDPSAFRGPRLLARAGRHSLLVYLVHQPVMFGLLWAAAAFRPVPPVAMDPAAERAFAAQCRAACVKTTPADRCDLFCTCAQWRLKRVAPQTAITPDIISQAVQTCGAGSAPLDLHGS